MNTHGAVCVAIHMYRRTGMYCNCKYTESCLVQLTQQHASQKCNVVCGYCFHLVHICRHNHYCRAASVSERSKANDCVPFEIMLCIYIYIIYIIMSTPCTSRCYSYASLMAAPSAGVKWQWDNRVSLPLYLLSCHRFGYCPVSLVTMVIVDCP